MRFFLLSVYYSLKGRLIDKEGVALSIAGPRQSSHFRGILSASLRENHAEGSTWKVLNLVFFHHNSML